MCVAPAAPPASGLTPRGCPPVAWFPEWRRSAWWSCESCDTTGRTPHAAIQPVLWLVVFGVTFSHIHAIPTGSVPYLDYLAPGIIARSALFVAIFYGIQIIWERDAGVLTKLLVTPTPRAALVAGKAFPPDPRASRRRWSSSSSPLCSA